MTFPFSATSAAPLNCRCRLYDWIRASTSSACVAARASEGATTQAMSARAILDLGFTGDPPDAGPRGAERAWAILRAHPHDYERHVVVRRLLAVPAAGGGAERVDHAVCAVSGSGGGELLLGDGVAEL